MKRKSLNQIRKTLEKRIGKPVLIADYTKKRKTRDAFTLESQGPAAGTGNVLKGDTLWRGDGSWMPRAAVEEQRKRRCECHG